MSLNTFEELELELDVSPLLLITVVLVELMLVWNEIDYSLVLL